MPDSNIISRISKASKDPGICSELLKRLSSALGANRLRFMEVCGTHTVSIFQSGLRSLLPEGVVHLSGPGCPVCVTHDNEIALLLELAKDRDIIIATFGDLMRVPGPGGETLKHASASGSRVELVYSPLDAINIARNFPDKLVVFPGIGFETTAPTVAATIATASDANIQNLCVVSMHKLIAPALRSLLEADDMAIDAFLLPGHVATVTGLAPFEFIASQYNLGAVVGGFEPADILQALLIIAKQRERGEYGVINAYPRAVDATGNAQARHIIEKVFSVASATWRGLGEIPDSGLIIRDDYRQFDALKRLGLEFPEISPPPGCMCGHMLRGAIEPPQCPMFAKKCTPSNPVGPCMVSTEGSCAAWYKYGKI